MYIADFLGAAEWATRGIRLRDEGAYDEAEAVLRALTREHPDRVLGWQELGVLYTWRGRDEQASSMFEAAIAADPKDLLPRAHYSVLLQKLGRVAEADRVLADCWAETEERRSEVKSLRNFLAYLEAWPERKALGLAHDLERRANFRDAAQVEATLMNAIALRRPLCLVRIGDGEGSWIQPDDEDESRYASLYSRNRKEFLRIWFGDDELYENSAFGETVASLSTTLDECDIIGIPTSLRVAHEYRIRSSRGIPSAVNALRLLASLSWDRQYCSQDIHIELQDRGFYERLFAHSADFCVITCHRGLTELIQNRTNSRVRETYIVPEEKGFTTVLGSNGVEGPHFPTNFTAVMSAIGGSSQRGRVWIVAAGFLGKLYCAAVRRHGGVAIDVGSIVDGWCGKPTRPTLRELSRFTLRDRRFVGASDGEADFLRALGGVGPIGARTGLVVAHPDDETIAAAGTLTRFSYLRLIHLTDGAPASPNKPGAMDPGSRRRLEVADALQAAQSVPVAHHWYGYTDGDVVSAIESIVARLVQNLAGLEFVITHPFEGGHIDHDACAFAVHRACAEINRRGERAPAIIEFASYHNRRGSVRPAEFWPNPACAAVTIELGKDAIQRRSSAFACHRSQEHNLRFFPLTRESFRAAPRYDFRAGPPPGATLYGKTAEGVLRRQISAYDGL